MPNTAADVVLGVLKDQDRYLISQRPAEKHLGGYWEFPGGKLEAGEAPEQALRREMAEELGIEVRAARPLLQWAYDYEDRSLFFYAYLITAWQGEPLSKEGQALRWVDLDNMPPLPPANAALLKALRLPSCYWITPAQIRLEQLQMKLEQGIRLLQLRCFDTDLDALLKPAHQLCRDYGAKLLLNSALYRPEYQDWLDGLHLNRRDLQQPPPKKANWLYGASCHDPTELALALAFDFAVLSPVQATNSHPEAQPLGWSLFEHWIKPLPLPVYALGGLSCQDLDKARRHGAQGIAGISRL